MKTFPTSAVWCFGILFISVSLITTGSSEVQVVGSADTFVALIGDDVILPCFLKPNVSAEDMTVEWTGLYLKTRNVHLYLDGRDSYDEQHTIYKGRTSMFHEELKNGNVSLKLTRVTLSDAGSYRCFLPKLMKETTVQLFVGAVSQPVISIDGTKGWGVVLKCESGGWFPEPEMEWLDSSGTILPADGPPERHRDSEDLYAVRRHVTVNQTDTNRFTCRVNQTEINHLKETEIHVPDEVFPKSKVGLIVGLAAAAVVVLAASAGVYKWRKDIAEKELRKEKEEQEKEIRKIMEEHGEAMFVNRNKGELIQSVIPVPVVIPIAFYLICSERYSEIHAATGQDQMRLLYEALEEAEDSRSVKSDFYRILLDVEPDLVIELGDDDNDLSGQLEIIQRSGTDEEVLYLYELQNLNDQIEEVRKKKGSDEEVLYLYELNKNLTGKLEKLRKDNYELQGDLKKVTSEREKLRKDNYGLQGELREAKSVIQVLSLLTSPDGQQTRFQKDLSAQLRKAKETISNSPGGQQKTQTIYSQKSEGIEGMEMESLPGRKSAPEKEMESLPGRKSAPEKESLPERKSAPGSGRKSAPEKESLLAAGPQKDDLDELERGGRVELL